MKKTKKKMKKNAKRIFVCSILSVTTLIVIGFTVIKVVMQISDKSREEKELQEKILALKTEEEELNNEILKLQDPEYLARYAREKYFYSKEGELIIRIPER